MENESLNGHLENENPADVLSSVLENRELMEKLRSILSQPPKPEADLSADPPQTNRASENENGIPGGIPDGLSAVLSNPEMMAKLPQVMSLLQPMMQSSTPKKDVSAAPRTMEENRNNLLLSLKPFLSPGRKDAVDAMLRISQLGKVLKDLK